MKKLERALKGKTISLVIRTDQPNRRFVPSSLRNALETWFGGTVMVDRVTIDDHATVPKATPTKPALRRAAALVADDTWGKAKKRAR